MKNDLLNNNIENIIMEKYEAYAKYIILDRALPDFRDGLKPVQRRILYALYKINLFFNAQHKKSAKIVGEVIGKYHPHGDSSVYNSMIRMSQEWKMNKPLIDIQGNNGSIDGDSPAAMRYTEAKLSMISNYILNDLKCENIVEYVENFDDSEFEPVYLPSFLPNLLINGASGIATGYATDIPSHNINEIIKSLIMLANNVSINKIMSQNVVVAPDFPTGGQIEFIDSWDYIAKKGIGKFYIVSKYEYEEHEKYNTITIYEIPYNVTKSSLVKQIDDIWTKKLLEGKYEIIDESDSKGICIIIKYEKKIKKAILLKYLCKYSHFRIIYNCNYTSIIHNSPKTYGVAKLLPLIFEYHKEILTNKYNYLLNIKQKRLEIINGLLIVIENIKSVVEIIMNSNSKSESQKQLCNKYNLTLLQADAILNLRLYRLGANNKKELENEKINVESDIALFSEILNNKKTFSNTLVNIYNEILNNFSNKRKTTIISEENSLKDIVDADDSIFFSNTSKNYIFTNSGNYIKQDAPFNMETKIHESKFNKEFPICVAKSKEKGYTMLITLKGYVLFFQNSRIKNSSFDHLNKYFKFDLYNNYFIWGENFKNDKEFKNCDKYIYILTRKGKCKIINHSYTNLSPNHFTKLLKIDDNDFIVFIKFIDYSENIFIATHLGRLLSYSLKLINASNMKSGTVKALKLKENDYVLGATTFLSKDDSAIIINNKFLKKSIVLNDYFVKNYNVLGHWMLENNHKDTFLISLILNLDALYIFSINNNNHIFINYDYKKFFKFIKSKEYKINNDDLIINYNIML